MDRKNTLQNPLSAAMYLFLGLDWMDVFVLYVKHLNLLIIFGALVLNLGQTHLLLLAVLKEKNLVSCYSNNTIATLKRRAFFVVVC